MIFLSNTKQETLKTEGFQVFSDDNILGLSQQAPTNLEYIASFSDNVDVFRTKLGDIKQIQSLQNNEKMHEFIGKFNYLCSKIIRKSSTEKHEILNNQYFCKPPNYKMTSAHQDNAYFESKSKIYTFWMPLQDVDLLNSCMFYVPGSHSNGLVKHDPIGTNTRVRTGTKGVSLYSSYYKNKDFVKVPMKLGEILVHDKDCMHFSSPNLSDDYRIAITCILKIT